jgi:hypothetical protein
MYDETGPDGKRRYTMAQIAAESQRSQTTVSLEIFLKARRTRLAGTARTDPPAQLFADRENARMDSATLLGLAGIGGTLLGTAIGAGGTLGAARVTSRGQAGVEEQKARRQAYSA